MEIKSCAEEVALFFESLPTTRSGWLCARVHFLVLPDGARRDCDHYTELLAALRSPQPREKFKNTLQIAAALDHALLPLNPKQNDWLPEIAAEHKDSIHLQIRALEAPLNDKHDEKIRQQWLLLRKTTIHPHMVHVFENSMQDLGLAQLR